MKKNMIEKIIENEFSNVFYPFISSLTDREKAVLELRAGGETMESLGNKFDITRERVRQIEAKAKEKIKYQKDIISKLAKKLDEFLFTESEVEEAFIEWQKKVQNISNYTQAKMLWVEFEKILIENKIKIEK
jgi:transcriptional regulator